MKRRCVPLRADHDLLTPDTHTLSGVRLHHVVQMRSGGVASLSGHLSDSSSSESAAGSSRRRTATSPTRRLRFEDETETEAESRYLERQRQRKRGGQGGTGVLFSKPDLNLYINGRAGAGLQGAGLQGAGLQGAHVVARRQRGQCGGVRLNQHPPVPEDRGRSLYRPRLNLRTEPIRETYIGSVTPGETSGGGARGGANQVELNGNQMTPCTDLPINPYAPDQLTTSTCPYSSSPPPVTSEMMSQRQEEQRTPSAAEPHRELPSGAELREKSTSLEDEGLHLHMKNSSSSSSSSSSSFSGRSSEKTAEGQAPPTSGSSIDGQVRQPMRAEVYSDVTTPPERFPARLSLRRLLSNVRLSRTRTGSLDRLSSRPRPPGSDPASSGSDPASSWSDPAPSWSDPASSWSDPASSGSRKSSVLLQKTPSVQSLCVQASPFSQLRRSWSVQSLVDHHHHHHQKKKKRDRSADYRPAADQ